MPRPFTPRIPPGIRTRPRGRGRLWAGCRRALSVALAALLLAGGAAAAQARVSSAADRLRAWGDGQRLELLPLRQSSREVLARSQVMLLIRPHDLPRAYGELLLLPPPTLDALVLSRQLRLCRIETPGRRGTVRCLERLPLVVEVRREQLLLRPQRPLEPDGAYGFELLLRNPLQQGFHPLRLFGLKPERPEPSYVGTWLLQTDAVTE
jgi:hypothetical protein